MTRALEICSGDFTTAHYIALRKWRSLWYGNRLMPRLDKPEPNLDRALR